jgi:orotidine-5'-phosphate decarboxylase
MNPVYVALDTPELSQALAMAERVAPHVGGLKLGKEFLAANGPQALLELKRFGLPIFADTKFHDIPKTVAGAVRATAKLGVHIVNVHASGGEAMLKAARDATKDVDPATKIIAVTVLTSMSDADLAAVGQATPARDQVLRLATLTRACGLDGVVCSAHEIAPIRAALGDDFLLVVPGIRPEGAALGDQTRVMGPKAARDAGASVLVIGRPITAAADPAEAARTIAESLTA